MVKLHSYNFFWKRIRTGSKKRSQFVQFCRKKIRMCHSRGAWPLTYTKLVEISNAMFPPSKFKTVLSETVLGFSFSSVFSSNKYFLVFTKNEAECHKCSRACLF